jgi:hypothetical protein
MADDEGVPVIWEAPCAACGVILLTDEHIGGRPYFGSGCECGGHADETLARVSDEPHPALWGASR